MKKTFTVPSKITMSLLVIATVLGPSISYAAVGQWSSVSRSFGTVYQNTASTTAFENVTFQNSNTAGQNVFVASSSAVSITNYDDQDNCRTNSGGITTCSIRSEIPPGDFFTLPTPSGSPSIYSAFEYIETGNQPSGTSTTLISGEIDNGNQNLFNGFIIFMIAFLGMVWLMRKQ